MVKTNKKTDEKIRLRTLIIIVSALVAVICVLTVLLVLEFNGVFYENTEKTEIIPPKAVGAVLTEGVYSYRVLDDGTAIITLFEGEESEVLEIPSTVGGYKVSAIGAAAYSMLNTVIREIRIPEGVTYIGSGAFAGMENIRLYLPQSIEQIDDMALYGIEHLNGIYYAGTAEQWKSVKVGVDNKVVVNIITN